LSLNNIVAVGDDQAWKAEAERQINELKKQVDLLKAQVNARGK